MARGHGKGALVLNPFAPRPRSAGIVDDHSAARAWRRSGRMLKSITETVGKPFTTRFNPAAVERPRGRSVPRKSRRGSTGSCTIARA
jgi:hypothetical protein